LFVCSFIISAIYVYIYRCNLFYFTTKGAKLENAPTESLLSVPHNISTCNRSGDYTAAGLPSFLGSLTAVSVPWKRLALEYFPLFLPM